MEVYVLSLTICISFILDTSLSMKCSESIPTLSTVSQCPSNVTDWVSAAKRKSCHDLARIQNCTKSDNFVYHCVLNEKATMLLEVCAPTYFLAGYCPRFSEVEGKFINNPDLDCTEFDPPCPTRFTSNESYKYQMCYKTFIKQQPGKNQDTSVVQYVPLVITSAIALTLLVVLAMGFMFKWIKCICSEKHGPKEVHPNKMKEDENPKDAPKMAPEICPSKDVTTILDEGNPLFNDPSPRNSDNHVDDVHTEEMVIECLNLTGSTKATCSLPGASAILDLRNTLSKKLDIPQTLILVVDKENGVIFKDDTEIKTLKQTPIELMLGNRNRIRIIDDDGSVENNVISNKNITYGKWKMSCGHFTDPETLFDWTKEKLPGGLYSGLPCPRCPFMLWGIEELVKTCNMSEDEVIFFKRVAIMNKNTGKFLKVQPPQTKRSDSKQPDQIE